MAPRITPRYLASIIRAPRLRGAPLLGASPRLPRTLPTAVCRLVHTIPKPPRQTQDGDATSASSSTPDAATPRKEHEPHYRLTFTCVPCGERSTHTVSKQGYHKGSVLISCPGCRNRHVISDNLNIFGDRRVTVDRLLREKGQLVKRGTLGEDGDIEFWEDTTTDAAHPGESGAENEAAMLRETRNPSSQATIPTPSAPPVLAAHTGTRPSTQPVSQQDPTPSTRRQSHTDARVRSHRPLLKEDVVPSDSEVPTPRFFPQDPFFRQRILSKNGIAAGITALRATTMEAVATIPSKAPESLGSSEPDRAQPVSARTRRTVSPSTPHHRAVPFEAKISIDPFVAARLQSKHGIAAGIAALRDSSRYEHQPKHGIAAGITALRDLPRNEHQPKHGIAAGIAALRDSLRTIAPLKAPRREDKLGQSSSNDRVALEEVPNLPDKSGQGAATELPIFNRPGWLKYRRALTGIAAGINAMRKSPKSAPKSAPNEPKNSLASARGSPVHRPEPIEPYTGGLTTHDITALRQALAEDFDGTRYDQVLQTLLDKRLAVASQESARKKRSSRPKKHLLWKVKSFRRTPKSTARRMTTDDAPIFRSIDIRHAPIITDDSPKSGEKISTYLAPLEQVESEPKRPQRRSRWSTHRVARKRRLAIPFQEKAIAEAFQSVRHIEPSVREIMEIPELRTVMSEAPFIGPRLIEREDNLPSMSVQMRPGIVVRRRPPGGEFVDRIDTFEPDPEPERDRPMRSFIRPSALPVVPNPDGLP